MSATGTFVGGLLGFVVSWTGAFFLIQLQSSSYEHGGPGIGLAFLIDQIVLPGGAAVIGAFVGAKLGNLAARRWDLPEVGDNVVLFVLGAFFLVALIFLIIQAAV